MALQIFPIGTDSQIFVENGEDAFMVDPAEHFEKKFTAIFVNLRQLQLYNANHTMGQRLESNARALVLGRNDWKKELFRSQNTVIPEELKQLLNEPKKKKQLQLIKSLVYHTDLFLALPLYAWEQHGMRYSIMRVDFLPKEFDHKVVPPMMHVDGDLVEHFGKTDLTPNEMKAAIKKRNWVISEFVGDETNWHCFFRTMAGIKGIEAPHEGFPHLHYISSAWGIPREQVVNQLSSYRYNLPVATIPFDPGER